MPDELLTVKEAAAYFKVDPYTIRKWLREGKLKGQKTGAHWRIPKGALIQ